VYCSHVQLRKQCRAGWRRAAAVDYRAWNTVDLLAYKSANDPDRRRLSGV